MKRELKNRVCSLRFSFSLLSSPFLCVCLWFDGTFSSSSPPRDLPSFHFLSFSFLSFCLTHFISSFFFPFHLCETENWKHFCPDGKDPSSSAITSKLHTIRNIRLGVWDRWESHYRQKRCFGASPSLVITHFVSFPFLCSDLDSFPIVIIIIRDRHFPLSSLRVSQSSIFLMEWWRLNDKRQKIHLLLAIMMMNCCWWWWVDNHNNNGQFCRLPIFSHKMSVLSFFPHSLLQVWKIFFTSPDSLKIPSYPDIKWSLWWWDYHNNRREKRRCIDSWCYVWELVSFTQHDERERKRLTDKHFFVYTLMCAQSRERERSFSLLDKWVVGEFIYVIPFFFILLDSF